MTDLQFKKGCGYIFAAVVIFFFVSVMISQISSPSTDFEEIEYFKSDSRNRVYVIVTPYASIDEMKEYAKKQMHTDGQFTAVFFYRSNPFGGSTYTEVSTAEDYVSACILALEPDCRLRYIVDPSGRGVFTEEPYQEYLDATKKEGTTPEEVKQTIRARKYLNRMK